MPVAAQDLSQPEPDVARPAVPWLPLEGDSRGTRFLNSLVLQPDLLISRRRTPPVGQSRMQLVPQGLHQVVEFRTPDRSAPTPVRPAASSASALSDNWQLTALPTSPERKRMPPWVWYGALALLALGLGGATLWACHAEEPRVPFQPWTGPDASDAPDPADPTPAEAPRVRPQVRPPGPPPDPAP